MGSRAALHVVTVMTKQTALCFCPIGLLQRSSSTVPGWIDLISSGELRIKTFSAILWLLFEKWEMLTVDKETYQGDVQGWRRGGFEQPAFLLPGICIIDSQEVLVQRAIDLKQVTVD